MNTNAFERLQLAVDAAGVGTWDFNPISGELVWSPRCKELFGLPTTAQVTYDDFLAGVYPPDLPHTEAAVQQALDPAGSGAYDIEYRTRRHGRDTQLHWARATGRAFFDADRTKALRFIGTIVDITETKRMQERLQQAYEDLEVKVTFRNLELEREVLQLRAKLAASAA
jgi:PAS domain S-box-containing protein